MEEYIELTHEEAMINIQLYQVMIARMAEFIQDNAPQMKGTTEENLIEFASAEDIIQKFFNDAKKELDLGDQNET